MGAGEGIVLDRPTLTGVFPYHVLLVLQGQIAVQEVIVRAIVPQRVARETVLAVRSGTLDECVDAVALGGTVAEHPRPRLAVLDYLAHIDSLSAEIQGLR